MYEVEKLAKEHGCNALLKAYIMIQCDCSEDLADDILYQVSTRLDSYLDEVMEYNYD